MTDKRQMYEIDGYLLALEAAYQVSREDLAEAVEALQELYDWQNGCPLPTYEKGWGNAMEMARKVLKKVEER